MTISIEELRELIKTKQVLDFESSDQDFRHGLRLTLRDFQTGELGILSVEPLLRGDDDREVLVYKYEPTETVFGTPPAECFIDDLKTRLEPDYERGQIPSLFD